MHRAYTWLLLGYALLLSGCSASPLLPPAHTARVIEQESTTALPRLTLTPELLYKTLLAEFSLQAARPGLAYVYFSALANQTGDPRFAKYALEAALKTQDAGNFLLAARLWHSLDPDAREAQDYYLHALIFSGGFSTAQPLLAAGLKAASPDRRAELFLKTQETLSTNQDKEKASRFLEAVLAPYASEPAAQIALARAALVQGDRLGAKKAAQRALKKAPDSELAMLALTQAQPDIQRLHNFLQKNPLAAAVRALYAQLLIEEKNYASALQEFRMLASQQPENISAYFALGLLSVQTQDHANAEYYLKTYLDKIALSPQSKENPAPALFILAQLALERKDAPMALQWLLRVPLGPFFAKAQVQRAQILLKEKMPEAALKIVENLQAQQTAEQIEIVHIRAQALAALGKTKEGLQILHHATRLYPENNDLLYAYAMLAERAHAWTVAEKSLRILLKKMPENPQILNALGYLLLRYPQRLEEAGKLLQHALRLQPEDPFILDSLGWWFFHRGDMTAAEKYVLAAYERIDDPEIILHLVQIFLRQGRAPAAIALLEKMRKKYPDHLTAGQLLESVQTP